MASAASVIPRSVLRSVQRPAARLSLLRRPLSSSRALRAGVFAPNPPPMEPHKQREPRRAADIGVGEFEGTEFRIEPMRRTGEDDSTMRARLVYQSRKRGILETDLLLSTFADEYLPKMTREQMAQYDRFLDENDWDIYYWATQEPPSNAISDSETSSTTTSTTTNTSSSSSSSATPPSIATTDTSSASYAGGAEAAISEATPLSTSQSRASGSTSSTSEPISTGGSAPTGDAGEGKEAAASASAAAEEPYHTQRETGEWAQTVGTFKPAYRPVPQRWRESEILRLLRDHVKAKAKETGGMAFMPPLKEP